MDAFACGARLMWLAKKWASVKRFFAPFAKSKKSRVQNEIQNLTQNPKQNLAQHATQDFDKNRAQDSTQNPAQMRAQDSATKKDLDSVPNITPKATQQEAPNHEPKPTPNTAPRHAPESTSESTPHHTQNTVPSHATNAHFIQAIKSQIEREKSLFPYEMLGRSLSYNPYPPRFKELFPALESARAICVKGFDFAKLEQIVAQEADIIVLDLARGADGVPSGEGLECVGYLRHYTGALIVLRDCFVDAYQVLQAVVYGADGVILDSRGAGLKERVARAFSLGLMAFVEARDARDVKNGVLAKAEGFYLPSDVFDELCSIVPKRKCICTDLDSRLESGLDASRADLDSHAPDSHLSLESKADFTFMTIAL